MTEGSHEQKSDYQIKLTENWKVIVRQGTSFRVQNCFTSTVGLLQSVSVPHYAVIFKPLNLLLCQLIREVQKKGQG